MITISVELTQKQAGALLQALSGAGHTGPTMDALTAALDAQAAASKLVVAKSAEIVELPPEPVAQIVEPDPTPKPTRRASKPVEVNSTPKRRRSTTRKAK
jgi:hypothetical protein